MIKKIIKIRNIGLLKNACAEVVKLERIAAIYAENGRGKSTLATIIRACGQGDVNRLQARRTIDSTEPPEVELILEDNIPISFSASTWTRTLPQISIFDSEFVEENVYSGFEIRPNQRQSLLDFALGDQAVHLKQKIEKLSQEIKVQTSKKSEMEKVIKA